MMERVRIFLVATPTAPVRGLAARLRDPDVDIVISGSAREALERLGPVMPDVVIIDGSLPGRDVFRLYGRLRATPTGASVPIIFSAHDPSSGDPAATTAPDYYLGPEATLDDVEQLLFTFLPESLVEVEAPPEPSYEPEPPTRPSAGPGPRPRSEPPDPAGPSGPSAWADLLTHPRSGPGVIALAYLGVYAAAEVLAAAVSVPLGLVVQAGLLVAVLYHAVNLPSGPERTFYLALGLAPLTRIYGLAQPYAGVSPLAWWGLVSIPMIVAAVLALRFGGYTAQEAGLVPSPKEVPVAVLMVPIGLALGLLIYMLLQPRALARDLTEHSMALVALIVVLNPGVVDEIVFRGVLQRSSVGLLGSTLGIVYTSLLYAPVIPAGLVSGSSLMALLIAFGLGVLLSVVTARTGSILSAAVAHASLALCLFVIAPYVVPGGLGLAGGAPSATATAEARPPTAKPVIVSSAQPGLPPAASQPGPTAQPASPIQAGPAAQPGPGQPATQPAQTGASPPVTLATPIAPPSAPAASPAGPPPQPTAGQAPPTGQIVVVRGTGGSGVRLRGQPGNAGQIITVVPEYTALVVIGPDRQVDGQVWHNVRAPNGQEGWIAASFVTTGQ